MKEKLRILVVTNTYPTDQKPGDSPQIRDQVDALQMRGVEVELLYIDRYRGVLGYIQAASKLVVLPLMNKKYDLIHAYYGHSGFLARLQAKFPVIVTFLGSDLLHPRDSKIGKVAARFANGVIVQSEEMKRVIKREDAKVIPFGVNLGLFAPCSLEKARRDLGIPMDERIVLFPWDPVRTVKRFDLIQEAVEIVSQHYENVRILTIFNQPHEIVAKYMAACDVMVLASMHEGSPMAVREAMACNLPIVSVDVGDVKQVIKDTEGCVICDRNPNSIAQGVCLVFDRGSRTNGASVIKAANAAWAAEQVLALYDTVLKLQRSHE